MNPNWLGVISAALAFVAFALLYRISSRTDQRTRMLLMAAFSVAALPGASFAAHYAHVLPETGWYYQFRSVVGTEFLLVFVGAAGGVWAAVLPRVMRVLPLLGVAALVIAPVMKPFVGPLPDGALDDVWVDGVCLQSTPSTCGAASMATILRFHGCTTTESEVATEAHSYAGGTEAWYLARTARSRGFDVRFEFAQGFRGSLDLPAVVGVRLGQLGHFIPILARGEDGFLIGDPLRGREILTAEALLERYDFTGFAMPVGDSAVGRLR